MTDILELKLVRDKAKSSQLSTIGDLFVDSAWECYTLEDEDRYLEDDGQKVYGKTAIPRGRYKVVLDWSDHFQRDMPHILGVPQFEGVRIHSGNSPADTLGCVLVGTEWFENWVRNSRVAFDALFRKLKDAWASGKEVWITIE